MRFCDYIGAAASVLFVWSSAAFAADVQSLPSGDMENRGIARQCIKDLRAFDNELEKVGFGVLPPGGYGTSAPSGYYAAGMEGTPRQKIRSLRDAAYVYALAGNEQVCQMVLSSMRTVYEKHQELEGLETDDPEARSAWRRAHLSRAEPIGQMDHLMRADVLIGSEIRNLKDEKLAEIEDLVLDPAEPKIQYVLVSRGGFLGIGESLVAIRWADLRATEDHGLYVLDIPAKALAEAPEVDRHNFEETAEADWQNSLSAYWDTVLKP